MPPIAPHLQRARREDAETSKVAAPASVVGGETYDPALDGARLATQYARVVQVMADGQWHTLRDIAIAVHGSEAGVSARLRDMRKPARGRFNVERRRTAKAGVWEYRVSPATGEQTT